MGASRPILLLPYARGAAILSQKLLSFFICPHARLDLCEKKRKNSGWEKQPRLQMISAGGASRG